mmetsp:Transcript_32936/g.47688  ORF Transcript_32936/g.47688 Transcript_32936/m.47688 type:complete len:174 (-) Transcript_32936:392-913(-)
MNRFTRSIAGRYVRYVNIMRQPLHGRRLFATRGEASIEEEHVQIPAPTWSIKSLRLDDHVAFQISDDELQRLAKRCLIHIDVDSAEGKKMKEDLQGIMGLVSHVTSVASGDFTPEEMYDSTGAAQIIPRQMEANDGLDLKQKNEIVESVQSKMVEVDSEFYFSVVTKSGSHGT